jgi:hypothetical protein
MTAISARVLDAAVRFELCRDDDVPALMRFIGTHWRADHILSRDEALLRWQFAPELLGGRAPGPTVMLAWLDDEIVGMLGLTGFALNMAGEQFSAAWLSHWFAAPAYRGYDVALGLMRAARGVGVDALGTLGANEVSRRLLPHLGFEVLASLPRWVGVFDVDAAVELVCLANPAVAPEDAWRLCRSHQVDLRASGVPEDDFRPADWSGATAAAWDHFWGETVARGLVGASRDTGYLQWRYRRHPRFEYQLRFAQRECDGSVEGITVFRVEQVRDRGTRVLRIVEFLSSKAAESVLLRSVLEAARDSGAAVGDFYCSYPRAAEPFTRVGFKRPSTNSPDVVFPARFQPLQAGHDPMATLVRLPGGWRGKLQQLVDEGRLYITKSDGDQDRPN